MGLPLVRNVAGRSELEHHGAAGRTLRFAVHKQKRIAIRQCGEKRHPGTLMPSRGGLAMPGLLTKALSAQALAAFRAAIVQDKTTIFGCHACAETVTTFANQITGLIGAFHLISPVSSVWTTL